MELADLNQPAWQVIAIVLFVIPGLNCTWVIERLTGPSRLKGTERLLRAVAWSVLIYAAASWWLLGLGTRLVRGEAIWPWEPILGAIALIFVAPILLGAIVSILRSSEQAKRILRRFTTVDPTPTAWDYAFKPGGPYFVRIKMRDGERVGGFFGELSFASAYPEKPEIFLEESWRLAQDGTFVEPVQDSEGMLLKEDAIELVELLSYPEEEDSIG